MTRKQAVLGLFAGAAAILTGRTVVVQSPRAEQPLKDRDVLGIEAGKVLWAQQSASDRRSWGSTTELTTPLSIQFDLDQWKTIIIRKGRQEVRLSADDIWEVLTTDKK